MKKLISIIIAMAVLCISIMAIAEDYSNITVEELMVLRDQKYKELIELNEIIAERQMQNRTKEDPLESLSTIASLFPDEDFALVVRDKLKKLSINDEVTQEELDGILEIRASYDGNIKDLTGISHLRNLTWLTVIPYDGTTITDELLQLPNLEYIYFAYYKGTALPEWFTQLAGLNTLWLPGSSLVHLPENIGNLINLTSLELNNSSALIDIPDSIGLLANLETLSLGNTGITSIPDSVGNLKKLKKLELEYTSISEIPASVTDLKLEDLDISHTNIK